MITYGTILGLLQNNLIRGSYISVMVIILAKTLFGKYGNNKQSVKIIKWILITYSVFSLIYTLALMLWGYFSAGDSALFNRATGPYWWAYWTMFSGTCIFPLLLLIPRLGRNIYFILLASIFMNLGWLLEFFTIYFASRHRDYIPESDSHLWYNPVFLILLQGFLVGIIIVGIGFWWQKHYSTKV